MKVTNQESAENLKEIISSTWNFIEKMQNEYLAQSMRTILAYFKGKADITTVRSIEMDFLSPCESNGKEQFIVLSALEKFDGKWSMSKTANNRYWNTVYTLSKGGKTLHLSAETKFSTNFSVYE